MAKANLEVHNNGATTALSYMAQSGASLSSIINVMHTMGLILDANVDESDKERFIETFGVDALMSAGVLE